MNKHTSVFLKEAIDSLNVVKGGIYVDATFGEGGHSRLIQEQGGKVFGIDADIHQVSKQNQSEINVAHGNFANIEEITKKFGIENVDGVLFDFGLSMEQLDKSGKGFSYRRYDEPLDMRIGKNDITAQEILEDTDEQELKQMLLKYSEDLSAEDIVHEIIRERRKRSIATVGDLISIINRALEPKGITAEQAKAKIYARIFQALRIIVNDEFESIRSGLEGSRRIIKPGGRIAIITFHSLEDRIVKLFGREHAEELSVERINVGKKRALQNFERSAQLRVFIKKI